MQNYIKSIREFLLADVEIQVYTTNIHWLRVPKENDTRPLIIFTEMWRKNPYEQEWGRDVFDVLFEFVVDYKESVKGREMRELLKKKISSFHGQVTADFNWYIYYKEDIDIGYDDVNDVVRFGSIYMFKAERDL